MASLVLKMSVSLDGYVAPTDGSVCLPAAPGVEHRVGSALAVGAH
jgi:hypothetical protein